MVDYGEQLTQELENARNELYKQITSVGTKLQLLWEVVRTLIVFIIPILTGIGITLLSQSYLPRTIAVVLSTICNGVMIGLVFLNITPLNEAINNYIDSRVYTPSFVNCSCKSCHDRNNCSDQQGNVLEDGVKQECNKSSERNGKPDGIVNNVVTNDAMGNTAGDNDETFRKRNVVTKSMKCDSL